MENTYSLVSEESIYGQTTKAHVRKYSEPFDADPPAKKLPGRGENYQPVTLILAETVGFAMCPLVLDTQGFSKLLLPQLGCQLHVQQLVDYLLCSYDRNQIVGATG